jgi:putative endonuclease
MPADRSFFVYIILANRSRTLYTGVTGHLERRLAEHRQGLIPGFTQKYRIHRLVYFEHFANARTAIAREKQIKAWRREKKVALIEMGNSTWSDLAESLFRRRPKQQIPRPGGTVLGMTS